MSAFIFLMKALFWYARHELILLPLHLETSLNELVNGC